jgi:hypothetical protein
LAVFGGVNPQLPPSPDTMKFVLVSVAVCNPIGLDRIVGDLDAKP